MLQRLTISHYALIEQLDINWMPGFSVSTGETGAGKSIMLGALNLLLGGRSDAKAIQTGQKKCMVEATFDLQGVSLEPFFTANDIDYDPSECIIRREVLQSGKSRAFINDTPVSVGILKELGASLIDIHSQHKNLLIRNAHFILDTLDTMATPSNLHAGYLEIQRKYKQAENQLCKLTEQAKQDKADQEYIQFQLNQIEEANLNIEEQEELEEEQQLLSHAEDIRQALFTAQSLISSDNFNILQAIRQAEDALQRITSHYVDADDLANRLHSLRIELEDIEAELEQKALYTNFDPQRLSFVEDRLSTIYNLEHKHHVNSIEDLLKHAQALRQRVDAVLHIDESIRLQKEIVDQLRTQRDTEAEKLTKSREKSARQVEKELKLSLQSMGMPHVQIAIQLTPRSEPDETGADRVTFLFSANKNIPPQDVSEIASGGEIARLMLAIKALISRRTHLPSIIFDEIDTGVSGNMAEKMARVMQQIAENCQVICITHLPQIAAAGTHHFCVYKEENTEATRSYIRPLTAEERINEIAHMLSGQELTEAAINNAKSLLQL